MSDCEVADAQRYALDELLDELSRRGEFTLWCAVYALRDEWYDVTPEDRIRVMHAIHRYDQATR